MAFGKRGPGLVTFPWGFVGPTHPPDYPHELSQRTRLDSATSPLGPEGEQKAHSLPGKVPASAEPEGGSSHLGPLCPWAWGHLARFQMRYLVSVPVTQEGRNLSGPRRERFVSRLGRFSQCEGRR